MKIKRPFYQHKNISDVIANFTPNWFGMSMGTGVVAICLNILSSFSIYFKNLGICIWYFNIFLFILFSVLFILRGVIYPKIWSKMLKHHVQPMFLGCIPMGLATIINGAIVFGVNIYGNDIIDFVYILWWLDILLSLLSILIVPYFMFKHHDHSLNNMTAVWLLPFVACEVAAASGGLMLQYLDLHAYKVVILTSIVLWSASVSLALSILVIFFQRLAMHKLPPNDLASSVFLPLGPTGTGALGMLLISLNVHNLPKDYISTQLSSFMQIMPGLGLFIGVVMWTLGTWWFIIALFATFHYLKSRSLKFNLGFWAYTFPLGVYTLATFNLSKLLDSTIIYWYSITLVCVLFIIWLVIFAKTIVGGYSGALIKDPTA